MSFINQNIGKIKILLLNSLGIKLREISMHDSESVIIEGENLPSGLYILKITGDNGVKSVFKAFFD